MSELSSWRAVFTALRRIMRATDLQSKRMVKSCGLTIPQVMVLQAIEKLGDVTVKRISDDVSLSQSTVTTILNRLESNGLTERMRSQVDKRVVNARLTQAGQRVLRSAPPLLHENFIERFNGLEDWEQSQILFVLQRLASMMDDEEALASLEEHLEEEEKPQGLET